ncbi:MAG TPA: DUF4845 domain-containing protein [Gammaproteobacteria bacterium]|nr:DUF4845 domain-containing protein [Gammaproteobacteria bacterium]
MRTPQHQKGVTAIGWILILALIACVVFFLLKLVPIYLDGFTVGDVVSSFKTDPDIGSKTPGQILREINKRLDINMIDDVKPDDISIDKGANLMTIEIDYEVREHLVGNIDIVVHFDKRADIPFGS